MDFRSNLVVPFVERRFVGKHDRHIGATRFGEQGEEGFGDRIAVDPIVFDACGAGEVFGVLDPREDARCVL